MGAPLNEIALLSALDIVVLERGDGNALSVVGTPPAWLANLLHSAGLRVTLRDLTLASPFLAEFVQEADEFWKGSGAILPSGTWSQRNLNGEDVAFQMWAVRSSERRFLLIKFLGDAFEEERAIFQKAREMALSYESLGRMHRQLGEANDVLEVRNREVERVNELKSEFLATMSHELRTPLNSIIGFSSLLDEESAGTLNAEQRNYTQHVAKASRHLLALINDILDLSKIETGHLELYPECFLFSEALAEVLPTIWPLARAKNISVAIRGDPGQTIYADRLRFKQILYNLLSNAIKFTPKLGDVAIEYSQDQSFVILAVIDNGIGIPAEERDAIFEKFHQVSRGSSGVREGTGLGLAITRRLVELHGGNIWVESEAGLGSRFSLKLPWRISVPRVSAMDGSDTYRITEEVEFEPARMKIAVVEDDPASSTLLQCMLQAHQVTTYGNDANVLEEFERKAPDLILLAVSLSVASGVEILKRLRGHAGLRHVPVVAVSAHAMSGDRERFLEAGFDGYVAKPIMGKTVLLDAIESLTRVRSRSVTSC
jgi:signal transduction histidine kinase/CheY-like chemotaxis protein